MSDHDYPPVMHNAVHVAAPAGYETFLGYLLEHEASIHRWLDTHLVVDFPERRRACAELLEAMVSVVDWSTVDYDPDNPILRLHRRLRGLVPA